MAPPASPAPPEAVAVETTGLCKRFGPSWTPAALWRHLQGGPEAGRARALADLSFSVPAGRVVGILGPNGAGKTTLLRCLLGILLPSAGEARLLGEPAGTAAAVRGRVGALIGAPAFVPYLSGRRNLELRARFYPGAPPRVPALLERLGMAESADRKVGAYSTGMKQRLGIAASLLNDPELWILDEPTSGLDPRGQAEVRELIREVGGEGARTVLVSSHNLHEIEQLCDHVLVLARGELRVSGSVSELLREDHVTLEVEVDDPARARPLLEALPGCREVRDGQDAGGAAVLLARGAPGLAEQAARTLVGAGLALKALTPRRRNLEQFFLDAVEEEPCS